jgi:hypothetical protein
MSLFAALKWKEYSTTGTGCQYIPHEKVENSKTKLEEMDGYHMHIHDMVRQCKLKPCL